MTQKQVQLASIYFILILGIILLRNYDPAIANSLFPPSLSREWGGFYCAGCGMLRALHQLLNGNFLAALRFNPLLIISLPYFLYLVLPWHFKYFYQINLYTIKQRNIQIMLIATISLLYGILRNTTIPSLFWLVPPS